MPKPRQVGRLLWVEGKDDNAVTRSLCAVHEVPQGVFRVEPKQGVDDIRGTLLLGLRVPDVERFGVVVDADGNAQARWDSIRHTLEAEGYEDVPKAPHPSGTIIPGTPHRPVFGAWIMPDNRSPGALEDFAGSLLPADDPLWRLAGAAIDSIPDEHRRFAPPRRSKARIHTWLAWQESPGSPMGQAITKGDLDGHAEPAVRFVDWLRRLMLDEDGAPEQARDSAGGAPLQG